MATYVLIHGAADVAWSWHLVEAELRERGHDVVAVDLPCDDDSAGLAEYTDAVVAAVGERTDLIVVGHSFGGFTAPLVCARLPVDLLVLVTAMIPKPGEAPGDWWANTGYSSVETPDDEIELYMHDLPPALAAEAMSRGRGQSGTPMEKPWPLDAWPAVPTKFVLCRDDRFFPAEFMRRVVRERLDITPDEISGSHCVTLGNPTGLVEQLEAYRAGL